MGWVYLDDKFTEHPKTLRVGGDAAWLLVCAISYANRNITGGFVPKNAMKKISDRRAVPKLVRALLDAEYLHEVEGGYRIHDYEQWQRSSKEEQVRRHERAKKAAAARWEKEKPSDATEHASSNAQASNEQCSADAKAMPHARGPHSPHPTTVSNSSSSNLSVGEEPEGRRGRVCMAVAMRRLDRRIVERGPVDHPKRWLAKVADDIASEHAERIDRLLEHNPDWSDERLAEALEPTPASTTLAAVKAADDRRTNPCAMCDGNRMVPVDDDDPYSGMVQCPTCHGSGVAEAVSA